MTEHVGVPARAQHVAVIDAVRAQRHRADQRHRLGAGARPVTEIDPSLDQRLDAEALRERGDQRDPRVRDRALIVELDFGRVQSGRPVMLHHEGDLLLQAPGRCHVREKTCSRGHSSLRTGQTEPLTQWTEAKAPLRNPTLAEGPITRSRER
jgi:hypothetical protein